MARRAIEAAVGKLEEDAAERGKTLDRTFLSVLVNFSRHVGVADLEDDELETVLETLGTEAIEVAGDVVRGAEFREVLQLRGCTRAMENCYKAAADVLGRELDEGELDLEGPPELEAGF